MERVGYPGSTVTLTLNFYENGVLFDPLSIAGVYIYDLQVAGNLLATLIPVKSATGVYVATWTIPADQTTGTYYDEWRWTAATGMTQKYERHDFTVTSVYATTRSTAIENRFQAFEKAMTTFNTAVTNLVSRKELKNLLNILSREIQQLREELDHHKETGE